MPLFGIVLLYMGAAFFNNGVCKISCIDNRSSYVINFLVGFLLFFINIVLMVHYKFSPASMSSSVMYYYTLGTGFLYSFLFLLLGFRVFLIHEKIIGFYSLFVGINSFYIAYLSFLIDSLTSFYLGFTWSFFGILCVSIFIESFLNIALKFISFLFIACGLIFGVLPSWLIFFKVLKI